MCSIAADDGMSHLEDGGTKLTILTKLHGLPDRLPAIWDSPTLKQLTDADACFDSADRLLP